jgi:hypothetical protein
VPNSGLVLFCVISLTQLWMPRKKKAQVEEFSESLNTLFPSGSDHQAERLRVKFNASLEVQYSLIKRLRNTIPDASNSDARNALQDLSDNLLTHLSELSNQVGVLTNRRIKEYSKVRILKVAKRQVAAEAAKASRKAAKTRSSSPSSSECPRERSQN